MSNTFYEETDNDILMHYGTPRHSGRYPCGSGENPYQHTDGFLKAFNELQKQGLTLEEIAQEYKMDKSFLAAKVYNEYHIKGESPTNIARKLDISTTELRALNSIAKANYKADVTRKAVALKDKGYSNVAIAEKLGLSGESYVRNLLDPTLQERNDLNSNTADILRKNVKEKKYIDIGSGVEREIGVSDTRMKTAVAMLKEEGYGVFYVKVEQATNPGKFTTIKVLAPPGTTYSDIYNNKADISSITDYTVDNGKTFFGIEYPKSISSDRVQIRYGDEGGTDLDGVIQLRRNVNDISLGESSYAQVRIAVDGTHYLKGMAIYSDNMPDGVDIIYNTNKKSGTPKEDVFKKLKDDPDNPFGAVIKAGGQRHYTDENGKDQLSVINKVKEEGDWSEYSRTLSSQFAAKQPENIITRQLNLTYADKLAEYEEISSLTNNAVKKKLLDTFASQCDASAVDLKVAPLPNQATKVILPVPTLKDTEIYAPSYANGTKLALVRYPHGGTFEIPILTVNNKQKDAKSQLGNAIDAVGINSNVAERLSGADFDGDTVMVIPTHGSNGIKIKSTERLKGLIGFDPKSYAYTKEQLEAGAKVITNDRKQQEMGKVTNLIADMTLRGANDDEICRAVKHSMVVIDSEKHKLDYKQSEIDNGIPQLKAKYQGRSNAGASTLFTRSKSEVYVPEKEEGMYVTDEKTGKTKKLYVDPDTGEKLYTLTGRTYTSKTGKETLATQKSTKMAETKDAHTLSSGTPQEEAYANYANKMKALANQARKEMIATPNAVYSPEGREKYKAEVDSLKAKLNISLKNAPKERQAQLLAEKIIKEKTSASEDMDKDTKKKIRQQAISASRAKVGATGKGSRIPITDREWEAIQAGAVSNNVLVQILDHTDLDEVRRRATPRLSTVPSDIKISKMKAMAASGYTISEIAEALGYSASTVSKYLK